MKGTILLFVAIVAKRIFYAVGYTWAIVSIIRKHGRKSWPIIDQYHMEIAFSNDQHSNAVLQHVFNDTFSKSDLRPFGNPDQTISRAIGVLHSKNELTRWGKFWEWVLDKIDPGHVEKALEKDPIKKGEFQNEN